MIMRHLITALKTARRANEFFLFGISDYSFINYLIVRNVGDQKKIKWTEPKKLPFYHSKNTGDLICIKFPEDQTTFDLFSTNERLKSCTNEAVKNIFYVRNQNPKQVYEMYKREIIDKVRSHKFDNCSREVRIAELTAKIRFYQYVIENRIPIKNCRSTLNELLNKRRNKLSELREVDYKKFEWILEKLDIEFKPIPNDNRRIIRNKSMELLAELEVARLKEEKLAEYKKDLDQQKVPFLEKKLEKLKWIQEQEGTYNLKSTVSNEDIENCIKELDRVRVLVQERQKENYVRKVHPFTLEVYKPKKQQVSESKSEELSFN